MRPQQPTEPWWLRAFGGVCQSPVGEHVPLGLLTDALNYELTPSGELIPQRGRKRYLDPRAPDGSPVRVIFPFDFDGTLKLLAASDYHVYQIASGAWTEISAINPSILRTTFAAFNTETNPFVLFGNGKTDLKVWDGTTCRNAGGGAPMGRPAAYLNYPVVFGIAGNPGFVQFAINSGDPDTWLYGERPRGLDVQGTVVSVFPYVGLVIFTQSKAKLFTGDPSNPSSVGLTDLSESEGCISHEGVADCGPLIWPAQGGIKYWTGAGQFPTGDLSNPETGRIADPSTPIDVASNISRDLAEIDWSDRKHISGGFWPEKKAYVFAAKKYSGEIRTWIYNIPKLAWFPWTSNPTCFANVIGLSSRKMFLCGDASGTVYEMGQSQFYDDNQVGVDPTRYEWFAEFPDWDMSLPNFQKEIRAIVVGVRAVGKLEFAVSVTEDFQGQPGSKELTEFILGVSRLGDRLTGEYTLSAETVSVNPGGFSVGEDLLGGILTEKMNYTETRTPMSTSGRHFRLKLFADPSSIDVNEIWDPILAKKVFKMFKTDGSLLVDIPFGTYSEAINAVSNQYAVPVASICVEWRKVSVRMETIDNKYPDVAIAGPFVGGVEVAAIAAGDTATFKNVSTNIGNVLTWKWILDDVQIDDAEDEISYTFPDSGVFVLVLKACSKWGRPKSYTLRVNVA